MSKSDVESAMRDARDYINSALDDLDEIVEHDDEDVTVPDAIREFLVAIDDLDLDDLDEIVKQAHALCRDWL